MQAGPASRRRAGPVPSHSRFLPFLLVFLALVAGCATGPQSVPESQSPAASVVPTPVAAPAAAAPAVAAPTAIPDTLQSDGRPTVFAVDPENPKQPYDFEASAAQPDLWVRIRSGFAIADLDSELVGKWEQWYASRPDYVDRMTARGSRYLYYVVEEIDKRGMPTELALLPFIESAFNPQALSVARASGMWQFMPATGRDFDLKQNLFRDDRRDVLASTRAALDYLQMLQRQFGDWQLALAAYNWGQGNVQRAIERNLKAGLPGTYQALRMPDETRNYVPKLQAVKNIVARPQDFAVRLPPLENHPYFLSVPITRDIDVAVAARLAGVSLDEFQSLNPQLNKPVILAAGTPQVLLPFDAANRFVRALRTHDGALATWTAWVAPVTLKPADAARRLGVDEDELVAVNRIPPRMLIKAGSTLVVRRDDRRSQDVPEHIAENARIALAPDRPPGRRVTFKAGRGGVSVVTVAKRYRVGVEQVATWNGVAPTAVFKAGQTVVVYQAVSKPSARRPVAAAQAARPASAKPAAKVASKPSATTRSAAAKAAPNRRVAATGGKDGRGL